MYNVHYSIPIIATFHVHAPYYQKYLLISKLYIHMSRKDKTLHNMKRGLFRKYTSLISAHNKWNSKTCIICICESDVGCHGYT